MNAGTLLLLAFLYLLWKQGGLAGISIPGITRAPVAIPGTEIPLPGGMSVMVPGGTTYKLSDGRTVSVPLGSQTAPGGWVQGTMQGQAVWLNTITGELRGGANP